MRGLRLVRQSFALMFFLIAASRAWCASVQFLSREGTWHEAKVSISRDCLSFTLDPAQIDNGKTVVILNKPVWMTLQDATPPVPQKVVVDGKKIDLRGRTVDLGCLNRGPASLKIAVADTANPVDRNPLVTLNGSVAPKPVLVGMEMTQLSKTATVALNLSSLPPGNHHIEVRVRDLAPAQNALTVKFDLHIFGFDVSPDKQTIRLVAPGAAYTVSTTRHPDFLWLDEVGTGAYLTTQIGAPICYVHEITEVTSLVDEPDRKVLRVVTNAELIDTRKPVEGVRLEFDIELRKSVPALFVTSRSVNLGADAEGYCFWGWLPGSGFVLPGPEERQWKGVYADVGIKDWLFIKSLQEGRPGIGVVTPLKIGESRFNTMLLYTEPTHLPVKTNQAIEMKLAIFPARSVQEVERIAAQLAW